MIYAIIAIVILVLIFLIIRAWNLPAVVGWRSKRAMKRQEEHTKRVIARRRRWHHEQNVKEHEAAAQTQMTDDGIEARIWVGDTFQRFASKLKAINNGDYDNQPIPSERRWKWFRRNKAQGDNK